MEEIWKDVVDYEGYYIENTICKYFVNLLNFC